MAANINRPPTPEAEHRELSMEDHVQLKVLCMALVYILFTCSGNDYDGPHY